MNTVPKFYQKDVSDAALTATGQALHILSQLAEIHDMEYEYIIML